MHEGRKDQRTTAAILFAIGAGRLAAPDIMIARAINGTVYPSFILLVTALGKKSFAAVTTIALASLIVTVISSALLLSEKPGEHLLVAALISFAFFSEDITVAIIIGAGFICLAPLIAASALDVKLAT